LYDPAMGPLGVTGVCVTCCLSSRYCPGHCGHIELPVPIINPLLFSPCFKILQTTCHNCYNFRVRGGQAELDYFKARLRLLDEGRIVEAANLLRDAESDYPEPNVVEKDPRNVSLLSNTKRAEIVSELNHKMRNSGKCAFCGAHSPKLRTHQKSKVLVEALTLRQKVQNKALGIDMALNVFLRKEIEEDEVVEVVEKDDGEYKPGDELLEDDESEVRGFCICFSQRN
jgi:DNA-directed RNA polymerase beta' subunit